MYSSHADISEPAYLPFIPRLNEDSVLSGLGVFSTVPFPFGNTSFTKLFVSSTVTIYVSGFALEKM